ncbi:hypothetical protein ACULML_17775 [Xanthomonas arboricola pv. corylina]|uniref:hypothetical protein n=1 Tax=Xanthomonas arboricola TaxID=56448 RepID=UPI004040B0A1
MAEPTYCPWLIGAPCLKPEVWAAWAQAVLSAVAIIAAAGIARWQRRSELAEKARSDALIARSFAMVILREMKLLEERIARGLHSVKGDQGLTEGRNVAEVSVPQRLWDSTPQLHVLGEQGGDVLTAIFKIQEARRYLNPTAQDKNILWGDDKAAYLEDLGAARTACTSALAGLHRLLEGTAE